MIRVPGAKSASALVVGLDHVTARAARRLPDRPARGDERAVPSLRERGGYTRRELWTEPFVRDGRADSVGGGDQAVRRPHGTTGSRHVGGGKSTRGPGSYPGRRRLLVRGGGVREVRRQAAADRVPLGARRVGVREPVDHSGEQLPSARAERGASFAGMSPSGAFDMAGNVREWCDELRRGASAIILGGGWNESPTDSTTPTLEQPIGSRGDQRDPTGAAERAPSQLAARRRGSSMRIHATTRRRSRSPDAVFDSYRRMFDYDREPLAASIESRDTTQRRLDRRARELRRGVRGGAHDGRCCYLPKRRPGHTRRWCTSRAPT